MLCFGGFESGEGKIQGLKELKKVDIGAGEFPKTFLGVSRRL